VKFKLLNAADYGIPQRRERVFIVGIRSDINVEFEFPKPVLYENTTNSWVPLNKIVTKLKIEDSKYYFSKRAVEGMKNAKPNMKRGLFQDLNKPCLTITSHLAKVSLNSRDPVLLVNPEEELYRRFTVIEAAGIQSFPEQFEFPVSDHQAYKQIGNAIPPVLMWHVSSALTELLISKFKK
jgi:DNA (cytosine-5)-methyltransferase 1